MLSAVYLHNEAVFETHKIDDKGAERMLAAELEPRKLTIPQVTPKQALRIGGFAAQVSGSILRCHVWDRITHESPSPQPSPASGRGRTNKRGDQLPLARLREREGPALAGG